MAKGKCKNLNNRNQDHWVSSEPRTPNTVSPGYPNTPEKQDSDIKLYLMMLVDDFKKGINNSLKEIQENTDKQAEALNEEAQKTLKELQENTAMQVELLKEETQKSFKELQKNTNKQVMELSKTIQDLKMEVETIKKIQSEAKLEIEILGKKSGTIDASIRNRIQEMEERISASEESIENMETTIKENAKCQKMLTQNIQEIQDTMRRHNVKKIDIVANEEKKREDFQLKVPINIFNKIIENFPNQKKEMPMNIQEAYRTPNRLDQKRNSS
jgi:chromosome segregation ATPase